MMNDINILLEQISSTSDPNDDRFENLKMIFESNGSEKKNLFNDAIKEMQKWTKSSQERNKEIYDTKGDITKFEPNLSDVINLISKKSHTNMSTFSMLSKIKALYSHFMLHKNTYMNAFKSGNETIKTVYVSGTWLIISYLSELCIYIGGGKIIPPDKKYGKMISTLQDVLSHPKFIEYANTADDLVFNTESILYETVMSVGTTIISFIVALRLIVWNMYMMRTKISDKLKVTAEFLEKNANRLQKTDKKNKDKIAFKQLKAVDKLNRLSEKLRIKLDGDVVSSPPPINTTPKETTPKDEDDDDIEL